jgi:hypothetical protein
MSSARDPIVLEVARDAWVHDAGEYIFTLCWPQPDRVYWVAEFTEQVAEEDEPDRQECASAAYEEALGNFDDWPDVKSAFEDAASAWTAANVR